MKQLPVLPSTDAAPMSEEEHRALDKYRKLCDAYVDQVQLALDATKTQHEPLARIPMLERIGVMIERIREF